MGASPKKQERNPTRTSLSQVVQDHSKACLVAVGTMVFLLFVATGLPKRPTHSVYTFKDGKDWQSSSSPWFVVSNNNNDLTNSHSEFTPRMVWLMSFPNSGTSYTMMSVLRSSNFSTATNYGDEVTAPGDTSLSIYPRHTEGPYWLGLGGKMGKPRILPSSYVMVKTHCGSRCVNCGPNGYLETLDSFTDACRRTSGTMPPDRIKVDSEYPTERVRKAIHLIRHPIHNFVARFHLDTKNAIQKKNQKWLDKHPNNAKGFRLWCRELDEQYQDEEYENFSSAVLSELQQTPCHGEVFKYVQWHNLAFELIEKMGVPSLVVHYEDYDSETFDETFQTILDFLELPRVAEPKHEFRPSNYDEYMDEEEKDRMRHTMKLLASPKTWTEVEGYFVN